MTFSDFSDLATYSMTRNVRAVSLRQLSFLFLIYGDLTNFNMAAVRHFEFWKFRVCHVTSNAYSAILLPFAKFH